MDRQHEEECVERLGVSLCMIVRDEELFLAGCLASAAPYVSEMIIIDTGSTDRTVDIALSYGARVFRYEWRDDFAAARNVGLKLASEPWVLVLDADERLAISTTAVWKQLLACEDCYGYYIQLRSWVGESKRVIADEVNQADKQPIGEDDEDGYVVDSVCRLFRNDHRIRFKGTLHEEVVSSIAALGEGLLRYAPLKIWHEGYRPDIMAIRGKAERNARILEAALKREPDAVWLRYAAGTEAFTYGRWAEAVGWLAPLAKEARGDEGYESDLLLKLSHACRALGQLGAAEHWAYLGIEERGYADFPDLYEALAAAMLERDHAAESLLVLEQALRVGQAPIHYSSAPGAGSWRTYCAAGYTCERLYRWEQAVSYYGKALEAKLDCWPAWERLMLLGSMDDGLLRHLLFWLEAVLLPDQAVWLQRIGIPLLERLGDFGLDRLDVGELGWKGAERETERETEREVGGEAESETERETEREVGREAESVTERETERETVKEVKIEPEKGKVAGENDQLNKNCKQEMTAGSARLSQDYNAQVHVEGIAERLIAAICGDDPRFWRGLLFAQRGDLPAARSCWQRGDARAALYLAALERRAAPDLPPLPHSAAAERALPRVRAWQALTLRPMGGAAVAAAMPPLLWCALLRCAPQSRDAARYAARASGGPPAQLAAGAALAAAADWRAAAERFGCVLAEPAQPWVARAAAAGLAAVMAARARRAAGVRLPRLRAEAEASLRVVSALFPL